jgi:tetratricopeptide (TPR) repeat protein
VAYLIDDYLRAGKWDDAKALTEKLLTRPASPSSQRTNLAVKLGAMAVWLVKTIEYEAWCKQLLIWGTATQNADDAERVAKVASLRPTKDPAIRAEVVALAERAVSLTKDKNPGGLAWRQMVLSMAYYRNGDYVSAERVLGTAQDAAESRASFYCAGTARLYRAISLFQMGRENEARELFTSTAAKIAQEKPLPADDQHPLSTGATHDDLVLWLALKEAKALIESTTGANSNE